MLTETDAVPIWERVLQRCWSSPCPNLALYRDWAGWWWCDEHKDRLQDGRAETTVTWEHAVNEIRKALEMPAPGLTPAPWLRQYHAGKAACKANHGVLADRWQEIGRQQCEATHDDLAGSFFDSGYDAGHADGRRQGAALGLGVAFALAVVAGALARGRRGR